MAYPYDLPFSLPAGSSGILTATVYGRLGVALDPQPAATLNVALASTSTDNGVAIYSTDAMPDGQRGVVVVFRDGRPIGYAVVAPQETENGDVMTSSRLSIDDYDSPNNEGIAAILAIEERFAGIALSGVVAASPTPTAGGFTVTLDDDWTGIAADLVGLWLTFLDGPREGVARKITDSTRNSATSVVLEFGEEFAETPAAGNKVIISG